MAGRADSVAVESAILSRLLVLVLPSAIELVQLQQLVQRRLSAGLASLSIMHHVLRRLRECVGAVALFLLPTCVPTVPFGRMH